MDHLNGSGLSIEDDFEESGFTGISSADGMDMNQNQMMDDKMKNFEIRLAALEAEKATTKLADPIGHGPSALELGWQFGEKFGKLKKEMANLKEEHKEANKENAKLMEEIGGLKMEFAKLAAQNAIMKVEIMLTKDRGDAFTEQIVGLKEEIGKLRDEIGAMKEQKTANYDQQEKSGGPNGVEENETILSEIVEEDKDENEEDGNNENNEEMGLNMAIEDQNLEEESDENNLIPKMERIVFQSHLIGIKLKIRNQTDKTHLFKVRCTDNNPFHIRPPVGLVKAGEDATIELADITKFPENGTRSSYSIYASETMDETTKARKQWKSHQQAKCLKRLLVLFEKQATK